MCVCERERETYSCPFPIFLLIYCIVLMSGPLYRAIILSLSYVADIFFPSEKAICHLRFNFYSVFGCLTFNVAKSMTLPW